MWRARCGLCERSSSTSNDSMLFLAPLGGFMDLLLFCAAELFNALMYGN